jgi:hypothetical protein
MDLVLIVITVGALALAAGLSIVGWKLLQQDRAELGARVESLRQLALEPDEETPMYPVGAGSPVMAAALPMHAMSLAIPTITDEPIVDWDARLGSTLNLSDVETDADLELRTPLLSGGAPAMSSSGRRSLILAAVATVMLATAGTAYAVYRPAASPTRSLVPVNAVPLELLSLNEAVDTDGTFVVTGLIGNPASARPADHVVAVVYLFDREGHYFATGRAAIDLGALAAGNQSPFVVKVPHGAGAARYRVGFREPDGSVVAHVDKRGQSIEGTTEGATPKGSGQ